MKIIIVIIVNFYCLSLQSINRYVAKTGSDSNPGTYASPFLTIQRAADIVQPGDTVIVRDGLYSSTIHNYGAEIAIVRLVRSGNSSGWITFRAENKGKAIIDGSDYDADHGFMIDNGASYIRVEGFEIRYIYLGAIPVFPKSNNLIFRDNHIHHIGSKCTTTGTGLCAFNLMQTNYVLIERNLIHDIGRLDIAEGCSVSINSKWNDHGIYLSGANYVTIQNNIFYNTHAGWAIHFFNSSGYPNTRISILNNTFAFGKWATGFITLYAYVSNTTIQNNIFYQNEDENTEVNPMVNPAIAINTDYTTYSGVTINHNIAYKGNGRIVNKTVSGVTVSNNIEQTDPKMVNPYGFDFRLQPTGPAINAGVDVGLTTDFSGNGIVGLPDIGAYESVPSGIAISNPETGAKFTAPASISIIASANNVGGTITKVDFYFGSTLLGSDNTNPYSYILANVPVGSYTITAKATNNAGASATSNPVTFTVVSSQSPVVSISSPASGTNFLPPASITITASAADPSGSITKVDFYDDNTFLSSDNASPYSYTITNVPAGNYTITAKATNYSGASTTSTPVTLTVGPNNQLPVVSISSPVTGTKFTAPATLTITASATDVGGTIAKVDFYNGSTFLSSDYSNPYSFTVAGVPAGSYTITAKTTDNAGASTTSSPVIIVVGSNKPPVVSISSPVSGAIFSPLSSITITASATDADGTIARVDFYNENYFLSSDFTSPYSFIGTNVPEGSYTITAKATDNAGATTSSTPVIVNVSTLKSGILETSIIGGSANETPAESENLVCYPVPFTSQLNIKFIPVEGENVTSIEILNEMGKCIINSKHFDTQIVMQLAYLMPGIYFVRVRTNKKVYNKLVIKN